MNLRFNFPPSPDDSRARRKTESDEQEHPACSLPLSTPPPAEPPAGKADLVVALRRLTTVCSDYLATAPRLGLQPSVNQLLLAIDAAIDDCDDGPLPAWGDDVEGFFLRGLLDELNQQPSNLYTGTRLFHGEEIPVPISAAQWRECLAAFRASVLRGDIEVGGKKHAARYNGPARPAHLFIPSSDTRPDADASARDTTRDQVAAIKRWTTEILSLAPDDVITVNELNCRDTGCPVVETVVLVFAENTTMRWRFERPACAVTRSMLALTLATPPTQ